MENTQLSPIAKKIVIFIMLMIIATIVYFVFFHKKKQESSWKPQYADRKNLIRSMTGGEGNSVVGMIGNPKLGAMRHESSFIGEQVGDMKPMKEFKKIRPVKIA